jgi:hypothetical protein
MVWRAVYSIHGPNALIVLDDGLLGDDREASIAYVRRALNILDMPLGSQISAVHQPAHYVLKSICDRLNQDVDWPEGKLNPLGTMALTWKYRCEVSMDCRYEGLHASPDYSCRLPTRH